MDIGTNWKFDYLTAIITASILPVVFFLRKIIIKHIKDWGSYVIEGIMYWLSRTIKHSLAGALTLKRYCRLQLGNEKYRFLNVPSTLEIILEIDHVFVTLTLEYHAGQKDTYNHQNLLKLGNRIRVIGDPGSGKSSLVKRIFRDSCQNAIQRPSKSRLPILLELKDLIPPDNLNNKNLGDWLFEYLRTETEKSAVYQMTDCFDSYSTTTGLLLLLDGLDEVSSIHYHKIQTAINQVSLKLSQLSYNNAIILTMRTQFHQQIKEVFRENFPHSTFLRPFSPSDIYEFLTRWKFTKNAEENISRIYKELTDRPTLREMCSNPLILSMYVAEDQAVGGAITPESRTEFYSKVTEELIIRRRLLQKAGSTIAPTKLREQRERILGRFAYQHLLDGDQPANSLKWVDAVRIIKDILKCKDSEAESLFYEIAKETGLITEEKPRESFRFIHLTFCEFLAAHEAVEGIENGWDSLIDTHFQFQNQLERQLRSRLVEVIPFASAILPRVKRYSALDDISRLDDHRLLARCFLETKLYDHPSWPIFVKDTSQSLLNTIENNWDRQWLRDLHLFNVVVRDAHHCATHIPSTEIPIDLASFFQSLVDRQKESLSKLLSAYATQDAAAAFRLAEICNLDLAKDFPEIVVSNCDQAPFFALIREQMLRELDRVKLWASLISESALRSLAVARMAYKMKPVELLMKYVNEVPIRKRWFGGTYISESFYTQCISIAVGNDISPVFTFPILNLMRNLRAPGSMKWEVRLSKLLIYIFLIGTLLLVVYTTFSSISSTKTGYENLLSELKQLPIVFFFLLFITMVMALRMLGFIISYNTILHSPGEFSDDPTHRSKFENLALSLSGKNFQKIAKDIMQERSKAFRTN